MPVQIVSKSFLPKQLRKTVNGAISYGCTPILMPTRGSLSERLPLLNACFLGETGYSPTIHKVRVRVRVMLVSLGLVGLGLVSRVKVSGPSE